MVGTVLAHVKIVPSGGRILVQPAEKDEERGGLVVPETAKEKPHQGQVVAVGRGRRSDDGRLIPPDVNIGDKVLYGRYAGTEVKVDDVDYLILDQDDVLGVLAPVPSPEDEDLDYYVKQDGD